MICLLKMFCIMESFKQNSRKNSTINLQIFVTELHPPYNLPLFLEIYFFLYE